MIFKFASSFNEATQVVMGVDNQMESPESHVETGEEGNPR